MGRARNSKLELAARSPGQRWHHFSSAHENVAEIRPITLRPHGLR